MLRPAPAVLVAVGGFSVICMIIFSYSMLLASCKLILFRTMTGVAIYAIAMFHGYRADIDFDAITKGGLNDSGI